MQIEVKTQAELDAAFENGCIMPILVGDGSFVVTGSRRVLARDWTSVRLCDDCHADVFDNASVEAYGDSTVSLYGNSDADMYDNSKVTAYNHASVNLYGCSRADMFGKSQVWLFDRSHARLHDKSCAWLYNDTAVVEKIGDNVILNCVEI